MGQTDQLVGIEELLKEKSCDTWFQIYQSVKEWTSRQWDHKNLIPEQVWHGKAHCEALLSYADQIIFDYAKENFEERELFLLVTGIWLHDIGVHCGWEKFISIDLLSDGYIRAEQYFLEERFGKLLNKIIREAKERNESTGEPQIVRIEGTEGNLSYGERLLIRYFHSITSGKLIRSFADRDEIYHSMKDELTGSQLDLFSDMIEPLAIICETHGLPALFSRLEACKDNPDPAAFFDTLKVDVIAALIQLCDILHMDHRRVDGKSLKDLLDKYLKGEKLPVELREEDWVRLFRPYYINDVVLEKNDDAFDINVKCCFNTDDFRHQGILSSFEHVYKERLARKIPDCLSILESECNLKFNPPQFNKDRNGTKVRLPVFLYHRHHNGFMADLEQYCSILIAEHKELPVAGFATKVNIPLDLDQLHIPMDAEMVYEAIEREQSFQPERTFIPLDDALDSFTKEEGKVILVLGDPGSGKTTYLKMLVLKYCNELKTRSGKNGMVPVYIRLNRFDDSFSSFETFIKSQTLDYEEDFQTPFFDIVSERRTLLLMDGLDEIPGTALRKKAADWIRNTSGKILSNTIVVVTCRYEGYDEKQNNLGNFLKLGIQPFTPEQSEMFIAKWLFSVKSEVIHLNIRTKTDAGDRATSLIAEINALKRTSPGNSLAEMLANPLLLSNVCIVHTLKNRLPEKRSILYRECIEVLIESWREGKLLDAFIQARDGMRLLQPVAYRMHKQKKGNKEIPRNELIEQLEFIIHQMGLDILAEEFVEKIVNESGLLTGKSSDSLMFMHLGFQEYLCAREIRRRWCEEDTEPMEYLATCHDKSWWVEVGRLLVSLEDPAVFVPYIKALLKQETITSNLNFLNDVLGDAREISLQPFVELLEEKVISPELQAYALDLIKRKGPELNQHKVKDISRKDLKGIAKISRVKENEPSLSVSINAVINYEMVLIPKGRFPMGSTDKDIEFMKSLNVKWYRREREQPNHIVEVPSFFMGCYPVTNHQYGMYLKSNKTAKEPKFWGDRKFNRPEQPVVGVSWYEAKTFAEWLSNKTDNIYNLPTESQWEYACRAGTNSLFYTGNSKESLLDAAWFGENSGGKLQTVRQKVSNNFGLYDMHGNVWEWTEDDWHGEYEDAPNDGTAWFSEKRGGFRVVRGGAWGSDVVICRSAMRDYSWSPDRNDYVGFRLIRSL